MEDKISMIYKKKLEEIRIFGHYFVEKNKDRCKIEEMVK